MMSRLQPDHPLPEFALRLTIGSRTGADYFLLTMNIRYCATPQAPKVLLYGSLCAQDNRSSVLLSVHYLSSFISECLAGASRN